MDCAWGEAILIGKLGAKEMLKKNNWYEKNCGSFKLIENNNFENIKPTVMLRRGKEGCFRKRRVHGNCGNEAMKVECFCWHFDWPIPPYLIDDGNVLLWNGI